MAVTCTEQHNGRNITAGPVETLRGVIKYIIQGTSDENDALTALAASSPSWWTIQGFSVPRQSRNVKCIYIDTDNPDKCIWTGTAQYFWKISRETADSVFQFDTGGVTKHITQSISTQNSYSTLLNPPDHKGAVGVTENRIEGTDIIVPQFSFSEVHYLSDITVTSVYKASLAELTGTVNNALFRDFPAGEVRFDGANGTKRGKGDWEITFRFTQSPNKTNLQVGDIAGITKEGWDYLWVEYEHADDTAANRLVKRPLAVHVEKVYYDGDFSVLGI